MNRILVGRTPATSAAYPQHLQSDTHLDEIKPVEIVLSSTDQHAARANQWCVQEIRYHECTIRHWNDLFDDSEEDTFQFKPMIDRPDQRDQARDDAELEASLINLAPAHSETEHWSTDVGSALVHEDAVLIQNVLNSTDYDWM